MKSTNRNEIVSNNRKPSINKFRTSIKEKTFVKTRKSFGPNRQKSSELDVLLKYKFHYIIYILGREFGFSSRKFRGSAAVIWRPYADYL